MDEQIWRTIVTSIEEQHGDDNLSRVARNIVHALNRAGYNVVKWDGKRGTVPDPNNAADLAFDL